MLIGLDFDNTIVSYDGVFHAVAVEQGLIDRDIPVSKVAVRDELRRKGLEEPWIEMQGYVYGCRMSLAETYEGVKAFLVWARQMGHRCAIISHKTKHPYRGPKYDLHVAAADWIDEYLIDADGPLITADMVSFHETKSDKINHISKLKCDLFLDDLPEILLSEEFSPLTRGVLFDPDNHHADMAKTLEGVASWKDFQALVESSCA